MNNEKNDIKCRWGQMKCCGSKNISDEYDKSISKKKFVSGGKNYFLKQHLYNFKNINEIFYLLITFKLFIKIQNTVKVKLRSKSLNQAQCHK